MADGEIRPINSAAAENRPNSSSSANEIGAPIATSCRVRFQSSPRTSSSLWRCLRQGCYFVAHQFKDTPIMVGQATGHSWRTRLPRPFTHRPIEPLKKGGIEHAASLGGSVIFRITSTTRFFCVRLMPATIFVALRPETSYRSLNLGA